MLYCLSCFDSAQWHFPQNASIPQSSFPIKGRFMRSLLRWRVQQRLTVFVLVLLLIEFLDELVFGIREASMPLIRDAFQLDYVQLGLLTSIPALIASFIEPFIGLFGDGRHRRTFILLGGFFFVVELLCIAFANSYFLLLLAFIIIFPASGAFVSLSQASLMDYEPERHEQNMARWTLFGSIGVVLGPLSLSAFLSFGYDWRNLYIALAMLSLILLIGAWRYLPKHTESSEGATEPFSWIALFRGAYDALKRPDVLRWIVLLEFGNLMMDVLLGFLALYFVDVIGIDITQAAFAVSVWTGVGLIGDFALVFLLEKVDSLRYLRFTAVLQLLLFTAFLLIGDFYTKLILLGILGFFNAGWYSILQGRLYSALPNQSGLVLTAGNLGGLLGSIFPVMIGFLAGQWGLGLAMWAFLAGPLALIVGLPMKEVKAVTSDE
jgi:FSR family fosmidomycin resistance protein-like MFS transporter